MTGRSRMQNCVVTGGAGFIGCAISAGLVERFDRVIALDVLHPQIHPARQRPEALNPRVQLLQADVTDPAAWIFLEDMRPDVVVHLAAETGTGQSLTEATRHASVNVLGTAVMLDSLARAGALPRRFVLTSSRAVYGEGTWRSRSDGSLCYPGQRTREQLAAGEWNFSGLEAVPCHAPTTRPTPVSIYGATKLAQEHMMTAWARAHGAEVTILRLQNVYGPGQSLANPYTGIVPLFCRLAREGKSIPLYEDGAMLRDFVLIDDVADAIMRAIDMESSPITPVDIGTGQPASIAEIAGWVAKHYGAPPPHVSGQFRHGDVRHAACHIDDAVGALGWQPRYQLQDGLEKLSAWIESRLPEAVK